MKRPLKLIPASYPKVDGQMACDLKEGQQNEANYKALWSDGFWPFLLTNDCIRREGESEHFIVLSPTRIMQALVRLGHTPEREAQEANYNNLRQLAIRGHRARFTGGGMDYIVLANPTENFNPNFCPIAKGDLTKSNI